MRRRVHKTPVKPLSNIYSNRVFHFPQRSNNIGKPNHLKCAKPHLRGEKYPWYLLNRQIEMLSRPCFRCPSQLLRQDEPVNLLGCAGECPGKYGSGLLDSLSHRFQNREVCTDDLVPKGSPETTGAATYMSIYTQGHFSDGLHTSPSPYSRLFFGSPYHCMLLGAEHPRSPDIDTALGADTDDDHVDVLSPKISRTIHGRRYGLYSFAPVREVSILWSLQLLHSSPAQPAHHLNK
ncbi:hypothetical protein VFPPC_17825 [Pochonia chlamydosporia 170]|uniref:Uncharacterized protein n=1 Tax=Pochonia chlamydosporia 170 TaxID=1380566 RepID=A0A219AQV1_METCM|nr:hypothetical protein VFPPC_17825 [Pochonia chlamydosporia 170]OWT42982.1 hypothetical protein VFPPC_17825 [Pochonia chlamydosporia 170]